MSQVESTYKSKDTEELLDRFFFRPFGYGIAVISKKAKLTPNMLTIFSIILGVTAGHLYYYNSLLINVTGIMIYIFADILDSADGQLARMTGQISKTGRVFDGVATNLISISIYMHLILRSMNNGFGWYIFIIAAIAGSSHVIQAAAADLYRHAYLYVVCGKEKSELDTSKNILEQFNKLTWKENFIDKLFLKFYWDYTRRQEFISGDFLNLIKLINTKYEVIPEWVREEYRILFRKMNKYYNFLTVNSRTFAAAAAVLLNIPVLYFLFEIFILNSVLIYVWMAQKSKSKKLYEKILNAD
ncbi:MAG: CDP-alcohol phosphatidyltransferase family protein [Ignavibacteriae bacterium]|nr:CDP-alcohol phosphatidyltransferase family protein [Ignavibacteriota bacterium]